MHWRGPLALMLPTQRRMQGQTSSWAPGCRIQTSNLDFKPACPRVSGFRLISGLTGVKNGGGEGGGVAWEQASSGQGCEGAGTGHGEGKRV